VEKRLPLFLFLSFIVLMLWPMLFPPPPRPEGATGADGQPTTGAATTDPAARQEASLTAPPALPEPKGVVIVDTEERTTEPLVFGRPGEPGCYYAVFSNRGGRLLELRDGQYANHEGLDPAHHADPESWVRLLVPVEQPDGSTTGSLLLVTSASSRELERGTPLPEALWVMEVLTRPDGRPRGVEFQLAPGGGIRFVKRILFREGENRITLELELFNEGDLPASTRQFVLTPAGSMPAEYDGHFYVEPKAVAVGPALGDDFAIASAERVDHAREIQAVLTVPTPLQLAGVHSKYFAVTLREVPERPTDKRTMVGASYSRVFDAAWAAEHPNEAKSAWHFIDADVHLELRLPEPGTSVRHSYDIYAGPKDREQFLEADPAHKLILEEDLGFMSSIGGVLVGVLGLFERVTGNWGVAIILLTLVIRIILFPLNRRFQTSMARHQTKMKRVQPKIEELKKRYANDASKLRQEQGRLMQEEGAFPPLGGCLPMLLQIPIFIGLYGALRTSFDLRHAPFFGWITDLSQPDRLLVLNAEIPILITTFELDYLNILPILMVVLWIWQQRGMPTPADEQAARMQKMMTFMPIVMGFFLYNYAAGLSLYMITQSGLGVFEQKFIKKHWPVDETEVEKKKSGCGPLAGFMENLAEKQKEHVKRMETMQKSKRTAPKGRKKRR
jgi:YidC/Oxa1 family membrane protein insertase